MAIQIRKAEKKQSRLRLSIAGPAGAGKTYSALKIATELGGRILMIDTERGSSEKYADDFEFDVIQLDDFHPDNFVEGIKAGEKAGYDVIIIDSTSHEWNGKNGVLELHEAAAARRKNSFAAWADVTPLHNRFIDAILQCKAHVIATVRSKMDHVQEKDEKSGRMEVKKVGMAGVQRADMEYEYDIALELNVDHVAVVTKTRCAALDGKVFKKPGAEFAEIIKGWLGSGAPAVEKPVEAPAPAEQDIEQISIIESLHEIFIGKGKTEEEWTAYMNSNINKLNPQQRKNLLKNWAKLEDEKSAAA